MKGCAIDFGNNLKHLTVNVGNLLSLILGKFDNFPIYVPASEIDVICKHWHIYGGQMPWLPLEGSRAPKKLCNVALYSV